MIITYYTSDADGPGSKFTRPGLNNYFTVFNREDPDGFKFIEHDSEHSLDTGNAAGANYNMVSPLVNNGTRFSNFNPHYMHEQLSNSNSDYLIAFQDRLAEVFADGGLLAPETVISMLDTRASEIDLAIIAESARWGDSKRGTPFTKDNWDRAVETTKAFPFRGRDDSRIIEVLGQLEREGWWDFNTNQPVLGSKGGQIDPGFQLSVTLEGEGSVYVTTDGSDPRLSGGGLNPNAVLVANGGSITLQAGAHVKARNLNGESWSPIAEASFSIHPLASQSSLRVSEVHYNPSDPSADEIAAGHDNNDDFEFMEVVNVSSETIDLTGTRLRRLILNSDDEGVEFAFPANTTLEPGARLVIAEDQAAFTARYGAAVSVLGSWAGGLGNGGEMVTLEYADGSQHQFTYDDAWYDATDGMGSSLEILNAADPDLTRWNLNAAWTASSQPGGTPGTSSRLAGDSNNDGRFDQSDLVLVFQAGEYDDATDGNSTFEEGDWNGDGDFDSSNLVFVFALGQYNLPVGARAVDLSLVDAAIASNEDEDRSLIQAASETRRDLPIDKALADWQV